MMTAPIALFTYCRPEHTRRTVEALQQNLLAAESDLIVYSDAARTPDKQAAVDQVRAYLETITGFRSLTIHRRPGNYGLAKSIIEGVNEVLTQYERVIVLEDDLVTSPYFLAFMNDGLDLYAKDKGVQSICGYMYPVGLSAGAPTFFLGAPQPWGWATWRDRWRLFESNGQVLLDQITSQSLQRAFEVNGPHYYIGMLKDQIAGRNNSWFIRWYAAGFLRQMLSLYPARSLVRNIGIDGTGVHCAEWRINPYDVELDSLPIYVDQTVVVAHSANLSRLGRYFFRIRAARYLNYIYRKVRSGWHRCLAINNDRGRE